MRFWDNKEVQGRGTKFCLVIDPEDGTHPIRTYGWSMEEVMDKVAKTAETAQQVINRQRTAPPQQAPARSAQPAAQPASRPLTADEQMQATADLSNPGKSPQALKTLLRGVGIDVDQMKLNEDTRRVAAVAQEWERRNPEFPSDERNSRLLLNTAAKNVGFANISAQALDAAYNELLRFDMLFDADSSQRQDTNPPNAPDGNSVTRIVRPRGATSYRSTTLRAPVPGAQSQKPKYTRTEIDALNSKQLRQKIEHEPGFREWYDREFSSATA